MTRPYDRLPFILGCNGETFLFVEFARSKKPKCTILRVNTHVTEPNGATAIVLVDNEFGHVAKFQLRVFVDAVAVLEAAEMRLKTREKVFREDGRIGGQLGLIDGSAHGRAVMIDQATVNVFENEIDEFAHGDVVQKRIFRLKNEMAAELFRRRRVQDEYVFDGIVEVVASFSHEIEGELNEIRRQTRSVDRWIGCRVIFQIEVEFRWFFVNDDLVRVTLIRWQ